MKMENLVESPKSNVKCQTSLGTISPLSTVYRLLSTLFTALALLTGCTTATAPEPTPEPVNRPSLLVAVEGAVSLKRNGWTGYTPVGFGTLLEYDDLLEVKGAVQILCGDLTLKTFETGTHDCPCPAGPGRLEYKGAHYRAIPSNVPYIQYPRNTLVLDNHPLLRWRDTGATDYTVALIQSGKVIWTDETAVGNEIQYPADQPSLASDVDYLLVVRDNDTDKESGEDPARGIGFRITTPAQRDALTEQCDAVSRFSDLGDPARDFALALCYATWTPLEGERGVWGEAWQLLESVAQTQEAPAVYLWMGDLLVKMTSPDDAEDAYRAALQRAETLGDIESQASAYVGLWHVTGDSMYQVKAHDLYEQLGDEAALVELQGTK